MPDIQQRSVDLEDMLVNTQKNTSEIVPTGPPYYLGEIEIETPSDSAPVLTAWGPPYYCTSSSVPAPNQIISGFWSCN